MANPGMLIKSYRAAGAVGGRRIVKFAGAGTIAPAAAATDLMVGVSDMLDAADGALADVIMTGSAEIVLGGAVTRGAPVTADAAGAGVTAASGAGNIAIGYALMSGVAGDIIDVALSRHSVT